MQTLRTSSISNDQASTHDLPSVHSVIGFNEQNATSWVNVMEMDCAIPSEGLAWKILENVLKSNSKGRGTSSFLGLATTAERIRLVFVHLSKSLILAVL